MNANIKLPRKNLVVANLMIGLAGVLILAAAMIASPVAHPVKAESHCDVFPCAYDIKVSPVNTGDLWSAGRPICNGVKPDQINKVNFKIDGGEAFTSVATRVFVVDAVTHVRFTELWGGAIPSSQYHEEQTVGWCPNLLSVSTGNPPATLPSASVFPPAVYKFEILARTNSFYSDPVLYL